MKTILIVSACKPPKDKNAKYIMLGEWCIRASQKINWDKYNYSFVEYHWDNRRKLKKDYYDLREVFELCLDFLSIKLNDIHKRKHSKRYWRILVGLWLGFFIQITYDRWFMLNFALNTYKIDEVFFYKNNDEFITSNDMKEFYDLLSMDYFNNLLFKEIFIRLDNNITKFINIKEIIYTDNEVDLFYKIPRNNLVQIKTFIKNKLKIIFNKFIGYKNYFFITTSLSLVDEIKLKFYLKENLFPTFSFDLPKFTLNPKFRNKDLDFDYENLNNFNEEYISFIDLISNLLFKFIPKDYLEGYLFLKDFPKKFGWQRIPKCIFTTNSFSSDDVFKEWAASCVENGTKLIVGQHGGNYGVALWNFFEYHQTLISDYFLTWGWQNINEEKIIPFGILTSCTKKRKREKREIALLVEMSMPRYSYHMFSFYVSQVQWNKYFSDQLAFVSYLPKNIKDNILVRLKSNDYGLDQKFLWMNMGVKLDLQIKDMNELKQQTKIYISTYNATTYLESLHENIPTIIFWDPKFNELRDEAKYHFNLLKKVSIFHDCPVSAAKHLETIWYEIDKWWLSEDVQNVRKDFCLNYCRYKENPALELSYFLKSNI